MRLILCFSKKACLGWIFLLLVFMVSGFWLRLQKERLVGPSYQRVEDYPTLIYLPEHRQGPPIYAQAAILVEAVSGMILYAKNEHSRRAPASTTKILTALVALEKGNLQEIVTVSPRAARTGGSSLWLKPGDRLTLGELLQGVLMQSGNDGSVALAEHIAGSEQNFVKLMNMKAKEIGALNTNFANPHGLRAPSHYSTAFDLAQVTRHALMKEEFAQVVSLREEAIEWEQQEKTRIVRNTNRLLWSFAGADGVKTGTTNEAGYCLVASATRDGRQFISVVLHSPDRWGESARLLEYGFNNFTLKLLAKEQTPIQMVTIQNGIPQEAPVFPRRDLMVAIPKGREYLGQRRVTIHEKSLKAPLRPGTVVGKVSYIYQGKEVDSVDLVVLTRVRRDSWWQWPFRRNR